MKVRIKSGECPSYLTSGKVYDVELQKLSGFSYLWIESEQGCMVDISINNCLHLNGGSWEVVDE
ncbi:MAG: hypothetical protein [Caudoviricetes sp.]|nr:MAG: hypothetical protein [Caudoviricetes sp.]